MRPARWWAVGPLLVLSVLGVAAGRWQHRVAGLRLIVERRPPSAGALEVHASEVSSDALLFDARIPSSLVSARWDGLWRVDRDGECSLLLKGGREPARVWLDGSLVFQHDSDDSFREERRFRLTQGFHSLRAELVPRGPLPVFRLFLTPPGGRAADGDRNLFPEAPSRTTARLLPAARLLSGPVVAAGLTALWSGVFVLACRKSAVVLPALAALVVLYAGSLRLEAVVREYWGMDAPGWARRITAVVGQLRPDHLKLSPVDHPYPGDPGAYLRFAREMDGFYDAHLREPLYPAAAKTVLGVSGGPDVGISLTSALFSTLLVWATYLVGSFCFGRGVGLGAALLLAVEPVAIALAADGWRDDAFAFFVLLSTLCLARLQADASFKNGLSAGVAGGAACLTRITSLSFLLPALLLLWVSGDGALRRRRLGAVALSLLIVVALVAPYLATCALVFGDPFVSINAHTQFYRARANLSWDPSTRMGWLQYLTGSFGPTELLRNMFVGLTTYPFDTKWLAYNVWVPHSALALRLLSGVGLLLFVRSREGRLLLLILLTALVPFAFTWPISGGREWRFTLHAYPFYLLAAAYAVDRGLRWLRGCRSMRRS